MIQDLLCSPGYQMSAVRYLDQPFDLRVRSCGSSPSFSWLMTVGFAGTNHGRHQPNPERSSLANRAGVFCADMVENTQYGQWIGEIRPRHAGFQTGKVFACLVMFAQVIPNNSAMINPGLSSGFWVSIPEDDTTAICAALDLPHDSLGFFPNLEQVTAPSKIKEDLKWSG